ncbi:hypothetical protein HOT82_gp135 [Gordonia phage Ronaldo]|uniref:Uncharacterized protein n=3 Tax=Ronaldovirus ronaldo TaxID=2734270 RepID=A0A6B9LJY2_9CAUD|nr:hypothetical protein HOT82_gp135 [Gordonia phage Ronaldo]AXN53697.1 hypothetical protein SEA_RONALDO_140 [Gordonia phage Ronaldo]QDH48479.1 hypothetical protein SEA_ZIKO_143 [Gordonia phage Ziko]QHB38254.1 hypothetical protein SEA_VOLT_143 [Gordonia phage Volt]
MDNAYLLSAPECKALINVLMNHLAAQGISCSISYTTRGSVFDSIPHPAEIDNDGC